MSWRRWAWSTSPWSAGRLVAAPPSGEFTPPPIPGGTAKFRYVTSAPVAPWSMGAFSGGRLPPAYPGGGIILVPRPELGVLRIMCWWPDAADVLLWRVSGDGRRIPVRGGSPLHTDTRTRRNAAQNPSLTVDLSGWLAGNAGTALSRLTGQGTHRGFAARGGITASGTISLLVPVAWPGGAATEHTMGFALQLSTRPSAVTLNATFADAAGTALAPGTVAVTEDAVNTAIGRYARQRVGITLPAGAASMTVRVQAAGMPAGSTMDVSSVVWELGTTTGSYGDGDSLGGAWSGTAGLSTSVIAPLLSCDDGECPFDTPTTYILSNPALDGGRIESDTAVLDSGTGRSWLTHPATPMLPILCRPTITPVQTYPITQGTFRPIGSPYPVVLSDVRAASTGTLTLDVETAEQRQAVLGLLADGAPILLRTPGEFSVEDMWISVGEVEADPDERPGWTAARFLRLPFTETDAPASAGYLAA